MAGHTRTVDTGTARRSPTGRTRRVREHLPPGEAATAKRTQEHQGARTLAVDRLHRANGSLARLAVAVGYVRSAAAKYTADAELAAAIQALFDAGDRIYSTGTPKQRGR